MANKIGNQDWKKRKKHGKPKNIKTPQILWDSFCEYAEKIDSNPTIVQETKTTDKRVEVREMQRALPYTWEGFEDYLFEKGLVSDLKHYKQNKDGAYNDYFPIITHIGKIIRNQKFQGAAAGLFNANIIARDLGLSDKKELDHKGEVPLVIVNDIKGK